MTITVNTFYVHILSFTKENLNCGTQTMLDIVLIKLYLIRFWQGKRDKREKSLLCAREGCRRHASTFSENKKVEVLLSGLAEEEFGGWEE